MTITLKIAGVYSRLRWPKRHGRRRPQRMTPEQWAARCKQVGLPYDEPKGPQLVRKAA